MENRYHVNLRKTLNIVALLAVAIAFITILMNWSTLPNQVPSHYNTLGEVDSWSNKWFIFFVPTIGLALWFFLHALEKRPQHLNMPGVGKDPTPAQLGNVQLFSNVIKNEILIIFSLFSLRDVLVSKGNDINLGIWEIVLFFGIFLITVTYFIIRSSRLK